MSIEQKEDLEKIKQLEEENNIIKTNFESYQIATGKERLEQNEKINKMEQALQVMNEEYEKLCKKFGEISQRNEKLVNTNNLLREKIEAIQNNELLYKNENSKLVKKIIQYENDIKLLNGQLKDSTLKNNKLSKSNKELTSKNKELIIELENRENRLKALRDMNMILENKGNKLVKKFSEIMKTYQDEKVKTITEKEQLNTNQKSEKKN
jgi:hypothetical protein